MTPLEDPNYVPVHQPINGYVPNVVAKWGPRSQLRWFDRFRRTLNWSHSAGWRKRFHTHSELHLGPCCSSCDEDTITGYGDYPHDGMCCCYAER